jgi:hypothetical protein
MHIHQNAEEPFLVRTALEPNAPHLPHQGAIDSFDDNHPRFTVARLNDRNTDTNHLYTSFEINIYKVASLQIIGNNIDVWMVLQQHFQERVLLILIAEIQRSHQHPAGERFSIIQFDTTTGSMVIVPDFEGNNHDEAGIWNLRPLFMHYNI